jgi:hypothetical protein
MLVHLRRSLIMAVICLVFFGFIYAFAGTGVSQVLFKSQANGSVDGRRLDADRPVCRGRHGADSHGHESNRSVAGEVEDAHQATNPSGAVGILGIELYRRSGVERRSRETGEVIISFEPEAKRGPR